MKPNKEHIKLWVDALRSGKYKQAKERLRDGNRFCCLGVACDVSKVGTWNGKYYIDAYEALPTAVIDWLGIESSNPILKEDDERGERSAAELNDEDDQDFLEIADLIERKYLK